MCFFEASGGVVATTAGIPNHAGNSHDAIEDSVLMSNLEHGHNGRDAATKKYSAPHSQEVQNFYTYIREEGVLPVVILCHSRVDELRDALRSLLENVHGLHKRNILAAQDGMREDVARIVLEEFGIPLVQRTAGAVQNSHQVHTGGSLRSRQTGPGVAIAAQYYYAIEEGFARFKSAPALILVEDDMIFSPDFAEFLTSAAVLVAKDPSLWIASAWNDNGYRGTVKDLRRVLRTSFFPGLGWTMQRSLWRSELRHAWPVDHFDWFLRKADISRGRECIFPEVPRVYHQGWNGSFMNFEHHMRHFAGIIYAQDKSQHWSHKDVEPALFERYETSFALTLFHKAWHVRHGEDLLGLLTWIPGSVLVIWHRSSLDPHQSSRFRPLARRLGIWEQPLRGARQGIHELWYRNAKIILINVFDFDKHAQQLQRRRRGNRNTVQSGPTWAKGVGEISRATEAAEGDLKLTEMSSGGLQWLERLKRSVRVYASGRELADEMDETSIQGQPFLNSDQTCGIQMPQSRTRETWQERQLPRNQLPL